MGDYFVRVSTTVLPIFDGHTITVRTHLSYGEQTKAFARLYKMRDDGTRIVDMEQIKLHLVTAYLVDWSVTNREGERVPIFMESVEAIEDQLRNLFPEEFNQIYQAIEAHAEKMTAARAQEKKLKAASADPTLRSPSVAAGVLTGSVS